MSYRVIVNLQFLVTRPRIFIIDFDYFPTVGDEFDFISDPGVNSMNLASLKDLGYQDIPNAGVTRSFVIRRVSQDHFENEILPYADCCEILNPCTAGI